MPKSQPPSLSDENYVKLLFNEMNIKETLGKTKDQVIILSIYIYIIYNNIIITVYYYLVS